jgi:hypothetical protein
MTKPVTKLIKTATTTHAVVGSCLLMQAIISCSDAGTSFVLKIQDLSSPDPFVWIPPFTLAIPSDGYPNIIGKFELPLPFNGGIDIVTTGTPGLVAVCLIINDGT